VTVTIASPTFGRLGGIESFVFALANALVEKGGISDVTICFKKVGNGAIGPLVEKSIRKSKAACFMVKPWSRQLYRCIAGADIVHCQNPVLDIALCAKAAGVPLVQTIHNWRRKGFKLQFIARGVAYRCAKRHWYNSDFVWNTWEPKGRRESSGKPPVLSNLPTGALPTAQRRGFLFVSRWVPRKGLETLLDAYEDAKVDRDAWPLTLVGDGPLRSQIEARLKKRPIEGLSIKGLVDTPTKHELIRGSRWMVTPPNTNEDLGLTPIEARHVGVPCIITRDGGLPEAGGKHALMCEPADPAGLRALLEKAAGMSEVEYARIAEATHEELTASLRPLSIYSDLYREAIGEVREGARG
jgi:glycosyltransferase involved in cell wall biosynthesis